VRLSCPRCGTRLAVQGEFNEGIILGCTGCHSSWRAQHTPSEQRTAWIGDAPRPFRAFLDQELKRLGFAVLIFEDGRGMMERMEAPFPHLLITNVFLPDMLGVEVCNHLKRAAAPRFVPVIYVGAIHRVTGYHRRPRDIYGADDYIEEGISRDVLAGIVARLTGAHPEMVHTRSPEQENLRRAARLFLSRFVADQSELLAAYLAGRDPAVFRALLEQGRTRLTGEGIDLPADLFRDFLLQYLKSKMEEERHG
jgi:DNA-binding response OmpR family regulator